MAAEDLRVKQTLKTVAEGTVVDDRFRIESVVGTGEMSTVYKAIDLLIDRPVALKVLHSDLILDQEAVARFQREAVAACALDHPNIVKMFSAGTWQGKTYVSMEFVEGQTLQQFLGKNGRMSVDQALHVFKQVFAALQEAHEHGVVHRDLKPNNIILVDDENPRVKIVDFGIAKILPQSGKELQSLTQTGRIIGSLAYMSPEQCMGFQVDGRSDIYSAGCVMYEMLVGQPVVRGTTDYAIVARHVKEPPKPSEYLDNPLGKLVLLLLTKDREERPGSAAWVLDALGAIQQGKPMPKVVRAASAGASSSALEAQKKPRSKRSGTGSRLSRLATRVILIGSSVAATVWLLLLKMEPLVQPPLTDDVAKHRQELDFERTHDLSGWPKIFVVRHELAQCPFGPRHDWLKLVADIEAGSLSQSVADAEKFHLDHIEKALGVIGGDKDELSRFILSNTILTSDAIKHSDHSRGNRLEVESNSALAGREPFERTYVGRALLTLQQVAYEKHQFQLAILAGSRACSLVSDNKHVVAEFTETSKYLMAKSYEALSKSAKGDELRLFTERAQSLYSQVKWSRSGQQPETPWPSLIH